MRTDCKLIADRWRRDGGKMAEELWTDRLQTDDGEIAERWRRDGGQIADRLQTDCRQIADRLRKDCYKAVESLLRSTRMLLRGRWLLERLKIKGSDRLCWSEALVWIALSTECTNFLHKINNGFDIGRISPSDAQTPN